MTIGVRYYSFTDGTGYGRAALSYMEYLIDVGIAVSWVPIVSDHMEFACWNNIPIEQRSDLASYSERQARLLNYVDNDIDYSVVLVHSTPELFSRFLEKDKFNIAYTVWETSKLPKHWPDLVAGVDRLLVPSNFNATVFTEAGALNASKVSVVPHMFEWSSESVAEVSGDKLRSALRISKETFVFYSINEWVPRKAWRETLLSFLNAFNAEDDVCLVVKTSHVGSDLESPNMRKLRSSKSMVDELSAQFPNSPPIIVLDRTMSEDGMQALHEIGHCYVSLTRGEGWGLNAYNAANFANPVIITGWSGHLDYLPSELAYLIDFKLTMVDEFVGWESYTKDQYWAEADLEHAVTLLREVFANRDISQQRGRKLQHFVQQEFSREIIGQKLLSAINSNDN